MDSEQLRLGADLLAVMRAGVAAAARAGAAFVAPAHVLQGLLEDPKVGAAIDPFVPRDVIAKAAHDAASKLPGIAELPGDSLPEGLRAPFARYDSLAFASADGTRTMYLGGDALHVFMEGAQRARDVYRAKHLVYGFTAEAVKDRDLLRLFGSDPAGVTKAVETL